MLAELGNFNPEQQVGALFVSFSYWAEVIQQKAFKDKMHEDPAFKAEMQKYSHTLASAFIQGLREIPGYEDVTGYAIRPTGAQKDWYITLLGVTPDVPEGRIFTDAELERGRDAYRALSKSKGETFPAAAVLHLLMEYIPIQV